jgi:hypothetical protein
VFGSICEENQKYPKTHEQVGCLLSSAIACILSKASGKAVIIQNESQTGAVSKIEYQLVEV